MVHISYFVFSAVYCIFCVVYLLIGVNSGKQWQKAVLKCVPVTLLLGLVVISAAWSDHLINGDNYKGVRSYQLLLIGLLFSGLGDGLLVFFPTLGLFGMISFAVAQCIYIALFGLSVDRLVEQSLFGLSSVFVVLALSLSILLLFGWRFSTLLKSGDHWMRRRFIGLVMPIALVYFVLISLMLWSALLQLQRRMDLVGVLGAIGGFLFYVSDMLIAAGAIWRFRILLHGRVLVMVTYYGAQLLITLSVPRRHTTEVRKEDLPKWNRGLDKTSTLPLSTTNLASFELHFEESLSQEDSDQQVPVTGIGKTPLTASWHSLEDTSDFEVGEPGSEYYHSSQVNAREEMRARPFPNYLESHKHGYQLSYELALDNMLTPFASPMSAPFGRAPTTYTAHVIMEIFTTEKTYVGDLTDIIQGYIVPLESKLGSLQLSKADIDDLFGNVKEIKNFNRSVLHTLKDCGESSRRIGQCFLEKAEGFKEHYSHYCNNYPRSMQVLSRLSQDGSISRFLKICQQRLNHMLPLGAYLLKPVQRVLKYSLLLGQLVEHMTVEDSGFTEASFALDKMTLVSKHINEMKKRYDAAIHIQGLQSLIRGSEDIDLTKAGDLVLEESLRYGGRTTVPIIRGRADRHVYVFLFRKLMLMTKKEDDGYQYKTHLEMKDIQLTERVEKEANCFQVRQVSTGKFFTLQTTSQKSRERWVKNIKLLLMESIPGLPEKAKMLIMAGFPTDFGDAAKRSPKSPHLQGRFSGSRQSRTSSNLHQQFRTKPRTRSKTSPSLLTEKLVQASLVATLQLEPFQETSSAEKDVEEEAPVEAYEGVTHTNYNEELKEEEKENWVKEEMSVAERREKRSDYLPILTVTPPQDLLGQNSSCTETLTPEQQGGQFYPPIDQPGDAFPPLQQSTDTSPDEVMGTVHSEVTESDVDSFLPKRVHGKVSVIPLEEDEELTHDSLDLVNEESLKAQSYVCVKSGRNPESLYTFDVLCGSTSEVQTHATPMHLPESSHRGLTEIRGRSEFTDDDESLFSDLMSKGTGSEPCLIPKCSHNVSLDQTDEHILESLLHGSQDSISDPDITSSIETPQLSPPMQFTMFEHDSATPTVTPNSIHRKTIWQSTMHANEDDLSSTPVSTPTMTGRSHRAAKVECDSNPFASGTPISPIIAKCSRKDKFYSVVRRHSFTSQHQHRIVHQREGSMLSGNSPEESPRSGYKEKNRPNPLNLKRCPSFTKGSISDIGTTQNDLSLEDSCIQIIEQSLVSPPAGNLEKGNGNKCSLKMTVKEESPRLPKISRSRENSLSLVPPRECEGRPSTIFMDEQLHVSGTQGSVITPATHTTVSPFSGNPNERLSFDEVLRSYDHYASATGKTARTKPKEKKMQSRSSRKEKVSIDRATVLAAKEAMISHASITPELPRKSVSRVQQLAREYSRWLKEHQKGSWFKRFSTAVEVSEPEPDWLTELRERRKSAGSSQESNNDLTAQMSELEMPLGPQSMKGTFRSLVEDTAKSSSLPRLDPAQSSMALMAEHAKNEGCSKQLPRSQSTDTELDQIATPDPVEVERKGGLKGWVRSIVVKFGGNK